MMSTMASEVDTRTAKELTAGTSLNLVLIVLVAVASVLLVICVVAAVAPVHVPRVGDSVSYDCSPIGGDNNPDATEGAGTCAARVRGRLTVATLAGFGAGLFGLLAFGVQVGVHRAAADS
jgi:hypothetical protein